MVLGDPLLSLVVQLSFSNITHSPIWAHLHTSARYYIEPQINIIRSKVKPIKPKHGSSEGRAGNSRLKGPRFIPRLDIMRLCFKIYGIFVLNIHGWRPRRLVWSYARAHPRATRLGCTKCGGTLCANNFKSKMLRVCTSPCQRSWHRRKFQRKEDVKKKLNPSGPDN